VLALGALDLSRSRDFSAMARRALTIARKVHMGDILLWAAVGILVVAAVLAILAF